MILSREKLLKTFILKLNHVAFAKKMKESVSLRKCSCFSNNLGKYFFQSQIRHFYSRTNRFLSWITLCTFFSIFLSHSKKDTGNFSVKQILIHNWLRKRKKNLFEDCCSRSDSISSCSDWSGRRSSGGRSSGWRSATAQTSTVNYAKTIKTIHCKVYTFNWD